MHAYKERTTNNCIGKEDNENIFLKIVSGSHITNMIGNSILKWLGHVERREVTLLIRRIEEI